MLSAASTGIFAATLLAGFLPGVKADCWQDSYVYLFHHIRRLPLSTQLDLFFSSYHLRDGSRTCDGIGALTYIMIGFATSNYLHSLCPSYSNPHH
jgi:hypothetical protein